MALRLRRDVQKASYYVWFLGAEEAKGLRGEHVINSVLPYLISRSRNMEPLKVTLQVSHKGIKIVQGSSKHLIPHSAITSSLQSDDIVACVLLLYNPATKCPLHVHGYRCDSETTAQALNQQLQILINRTENQKRFEELENRLGIMPPTAANNKSSAHHAHKPHYPVQRRHHELSPKRFSSSLGSDTGHSTRESECSEEHNGNSPISHSPPHIGPKAILTNGNHNNQHGHINNVNNNIIIPNQGNELFDSLAAELRAKLNGNGPPILLPPRDYDTVHRSKGNLTAIELRRCRNSLIVGNTTPTIIENPSPAKGNSVSPPAPTNANVKQVSSRGSSGIGSDLAPSPERQDLNSSSEDEQWSNEADSSVIALKPSQISVERSPPIISHHISQLQRKITKIPPPEDSYLRDLPAKPYNPRPSNRDNFSAEKIIPLGEPLRAKLNSKPSTWTKEDEIKPIIVRPTDYDAKFNRLIQAERELKQQDHREKTRERETEFTKLKSTNKYNEINHMLNKKLSLDCESPTPRDNEAHELEDDSVQSDHSTGEQLVRSVGYRSENMTDKQKFMEYSTKKSGDSRDKAHKYGARQRYVDPAELPFEKANAMPGPNKYAAQHRAMPIVSKSSDGKSMEREGRTPERSRHHAINEPERRGHSREKSGDRYSRSHERNPYRESESLPYIESMEKMIKSSAMRYKSYDGIEAAPTKQDYAQKTNVRTGNSTKSFKNDDLEDPKSFKTLERRQEYVPNRVTGPKDRFKDAKEKFCAIEERVGRSYDRNDGKELKAPPRNRDKTAYVENSPRGRRYTDWSDEDHLEVETPPPSPPMRSHSRSREQWEREIVTQTRNQRHEFAPQTRDVHKSKPQLRPMRNERDYSPAMEQSHGGERRTYEKQRVGHMYSAAAEIYPSQVNGPTSMASAKSLSNLNKGYRHSYAEPVFGRSAGRVGLAAVNPY